MTTAPHAKVEVIKRTLAVRSGPMCFFCIAGTAGLSVMEVTATMEQPSMTGLTFQRAECVSCRGEALWCVEQREVVGTGRLL